MAVLIIFPVILQTVINLKMLTHNWDVLQCINRQALWYFAL